MTKTYTIIVELPTKIFTVREVPGSHTGLDVVSFLRSKGGKDTGFHKYHSRIRE